MPLRRSTSVKATRSPAAVLLALALVSVAASVGACSKAPTTITLEITSDVPCESLRGVSIAVTSPESVDTSPPRITTAQCSPGPDGSTRVGSLVVVPGGALDALVGLRVLAGVERGVERCDAAEGFSGCVVARRILRFVAGEALTVRLSLSAACLGVSCDATHTCADGACLSARIEDSGRCRDAGCGDEALSAGSTPPAPSVDGGADALGPSGCRANQKLCDGKCVEHDNAAFGCGAVGCTPCPGLGIASSVCNGAACATAGCGPDHKSCAGNCVPRDPLHGCGGGSCAPCESANGKAGCDATGACSLVCNAGSKLCGGRCVRVDDPNYGCGETGCSMSMCPDAGAGTLVCAGGACVVGTCGPGTKQCGNVCVPTDATNGCDAASCSPCAAGQVCAGAPTQCQCVAEPLATTCGTKACGTTTNNCGDAVTCPDTCQAPQVCGGGGAGANGCGCTADNAAPCVGVACGPAPVSNNCGESITCPSTCVAPKTCGGGGAGQNGCGCTPIPKSVACPEPCGRAPNGCGGTYTCGPLHACR